MAASPTFHCHVCTDMRQLANRVLVVWDKPSALITTTKTPIHVFHLFINSKPKEDEILRPLMQNQLALLTLFLPMRVYGKYWSPDLLRRLALSGNDSQVCMSITDEWLVQNPDKAKWKTYLSEAPEPSPYRGPSSVTAAVKEF
jgi:hypothetical protein